MVADLVASRTKADLHVHGAEIVGLTKMSATYPAADWTGKQCEDNLEAASVEFTWTLDTAEKKLYKQCNYRNGVLDAGFDNKLANAGSCDESQGTFKCAATDEDAISAANRKRLYCVEAFFCPADAGACDAANVDVSLSELRCSTGLVYDGSPADVVPALISQTGVRFSWLDTSQEEEGFRIFRSPVDAPAKSTLIADIPTKSAKCAPRASTGPAVDLYRNS
jgi:hypothetical protein